MVEINQMNKQTKKSIAFFLVVLCGVSLINCMSNREPQADQDSITRAEQREAEFMQKRAEYIEKHGHPTRQEIQQKQSTVLIKGSSSDVF